MTDRFDEVVGNVHRRGWGKPSRPAAVELMVVAAVGHGFSVDRSTPAGGTAGVWVVDAGVSVVRQIAGFLGLGQAGQH